MARQTSADHATATSYAPLLLCPRPSPLLPAYGRSSDKSRILPRQSLLSSARQLVLAEQFLPAGGVTQVQAQVLKLLYIAHGVDCRNNLGGWFAQSLPTEQ